MDSIELSVEEILNKQVIIDRVLKNALIREFVASNLQPNSKTVREFAEETWNKYPKLKPIYKEKDNLLDALMDEFELPYE